MFTTIGVLAHVDAGKTTFSEHVLYHANALRETGRVDHQNSFLDSHTLEKERGITVFSDQASFTWNDTTYTIVDTPGHIDFSPEMERSIQILDVAIVIVSAVEGIQGHTETVWNLLRKHHVPTCIFINKTDRAEADISSVYESLQSELSRDLFHLSWMDQEGRLTEEGIEWVAERDEDVLHTYVESGYDQSMWLETMRTLLQREEIFICGEGSALNDVGVQEYMDQLDLLIETSFDNQGPFTGRVYKIRHDVHGNRQTYIKALSGELHVRDEIEVKNNKVEKITQIMSIHGNTLKPVQSIVAGQLFAVTGLSTFKAGDKVGENEQEQLFDVIPTLKAKVIHDSTAHPKKLLQSFRLLDAEEPSLHVEWDEYFQAIYVRVMGVIQLEILEKLVCDRFGYEITFGEPEILYKETIHSEVVGYGHFEPLGHYAEVHLKIEPAANGSGVSFKTICHPNDLSVSYQNAVEQYVLEQDHRGLLTGSSLTDVSCTLLIGRSHQEHTAGGDFKEAVQRAIRQGLEKATNILLEPYYQFSIKVHHSLMGQVLNDIQRGSGRFETPVTVGEHVHITGKVPVATFMDYPLKFASLTGGRGVLTFVFGGYDQCHNTQEVVERIAYNKDADPLYTSSSIFCAKGKGYSVTWDKAEAHMHCL